MPSQNDVTLKCDTANYITNVEYTGTFNHPDVSTGSITATPNGDKKIWTVTIYCDRHGTDQVAADFRVLFNDPPASHMYAETIIDSVPEKLNFYASFKMTTSDGGSFDIYLAQGHHGSTNNWWIGSNSLTNLPTGTKTLKQPDPKVEIDVRAPDHKSFLFTKVP